MNDINTAHTACLTELIHSLLSSRLDHRGKKMQLFNYAVITILILHENIWNCLGATDRIVLNCNKQIN